MRPAYHFDEFCFRFGVCFLLLWCQAPLKDICPLVEDTFLDGVRHQTAESKLPSVYTMNNHVPDWMSANFKRLFTSNTLFVKVCNHFISLDTGICYKYSIGTRWYSKFFDNWTSYFFSTDASIGPESLRYAVLNWKYPELYFISQEICR